MGMNDGLHRRGFLGAVSAATALTASDLAVAGIAEVSVEDLTLQHFQPRIGERFLLLVDDQRYDVELIKAESNGNGFDRPAKFRQPFSALFGGRVPRPQQGTYALKNAELGRCALFLVPIGEEDGYVKFEACFS